MKLLQEFKAFALRGNAIDLAVAVVIAGAFQKIFTTLVEKLIMPIAGLLFGTDIAKLDYRPFPPTDANPNPPTLIYGAVLQEVIHFLIISFLLFLMIKGINQLFKKPQTPAEPPPTPEEILLLREIRDAMQRNAVRRVE